ncbi:MAG: CocE/NonD family hydrolase [Clostridia bacterium]|nr:CocE/NonD family hydrolase [Clostridia bacterium]
MPAYAFKETNAETRDGILLFTRIIFPLAYRKGDKLPVVYHRTPYELPGNIAPFDPVHIGRPFSDFLERGYIVVNQHCRGTGGSTGQFKNMGNERNDSLDSLDWIRKQDFYNGEIFLYGNSYKSYIHSTVLSLNPPDVKGAALAVMPANQHYCCYEKNTFKHDLYTMWFAKTYMVNDLDIPAVYAKMREELKKKPAVTLAERVYGHDVPELTEAFTHSSADDPFWCDEATGFGQTASAPLRTNIPLLLVGGLYDIHYKGTVEYFEALPEEQKKQSAMLMGPWTHSMNTLPEHKNIFPYSVHPPVEAEWFDSLRDIGDLNYVTKGMVTYYRPGSGWIRAAHIGDCADGELTLYPTESRTLAPEPSDGSIAFVYDPENPLSLPGGASIFQTPARGPQPQPEPNFRQDLVSFVSDAFEKTVRVDGRVDVELNVISDCPDTAFFVRVDAVREGIALCLRDTIVSVSELVANYIPNTATVLRFSLDEVEWDFVRGDKLRIDVSSSNFPTYNTHSNTKEPWYLAEETRHARNTVITEGTSFTFRTVGNGSSSSGK